MHHPKTMHACLEGILGGCKEIFRTGCLCFRFSREKADDQIGIDEAGIHSFKPSRSAWPSLSGSRRVLS